MKTVQQLDINHPNRIAIINILNLNVSGTVIIYQNLDVNDKDTPGVYYLINYCIDSS